MAKMTDTELAALLADEERSAVGFHNSTLADDQEVALNFYYGEPFGDEEEGRSQAVTRDVAEVVDYMTVSVLRSFVSGDRVVEFEPGSEAEETAAEDATDAVHFWFMKKQDGYRVLHDWLKSGLIEKIGVVKTVCEPETKVRRERLDGVPGEVLAQLQADGAKLVAFDVAGAGEDGEELYSVVVERGTTEKVYRDYPIPSEEFLFARRTRSEDDADYLAHRRRVTRSDLIGMGFDRELVEGLSDNAGGGDMDYRSTNRFEDEDWDSRDNRNDAAMREFWLLEEYVRADRDDDGRAELLMVQRVANTVLAVSEVDEAPFAVFTPFPMQHRMVGQSLADKVMDIQRSRSVLLRQTFDSLYQSNAPRTLLHEDSISENTLDDLMTVRPNAVIRYKGPQAPQPWQTANAAGASLPVMEMLLGERESRTGITRLNQGLDADSINKTATGTALIQAQGQQIEEYVARNFAGCAARLFAKKLRLMIKHADKTMAIKQGGQFRDIDPRLWRDDMDVSVRVGLGSGRKDQRLQYRQQILELQAQAVQLSPDLVSPEKFFRSVEGLVADMGLGNAADYFIDPAGDEGRAVAEAKAGQPPMPDPEMAKVAAQAQSDQSRMQLEQQKAVADMQMRERESAAKLQQMQREFDAKMAMEGQRADREYELAIEKMNREHELAIQRMRLEAAMNVAGGDDDLPENRPGGSLSA